MADKQETNEDIRQLSQRIETITTSDDNKNSHDRTEMDQSTSNITVRSNYCKQERRRNSSSVGEIQKAEPQLLAIDLPEKIVFVVDTIRERDGTFFEMNNHRFTPLQMIKRTINVFVHAKSIINQRHEYGLMILDANSTQWICDPTSNIKKFLNALERIPETHVNDDEELYDFAECFEKLLDNIPITDNTFVNRVILIYSRTNISPDCSRPANLEILMKMPYFFLDALYVHEPPTDETRCNEIYDTLVQLDVKKNSYIFEVGRSSSVIHHIMAQLLAHPLQRPQQGLTNYNLCCQEITTIE